MLKPIIEVERLGKRYRIGANRERYLSLREELAKRFSLARRNAHARQSEFWALKDVSFSVREGEAVGIIGRNGAGKSTLLKILSQITPPTEGRVTLRGRVASLLEVGTGFHPELTGRENVYLNGAILGMTRAEIRRKFDDIVAFAGVERFLDTPVKRFSSGMYVRLAFAVAAYLEPEILLVDEVLAVGDAEFQSKCLGRMGEVARSGRTVLFVSHNMAAISTLCGRCAMLNNGQLSLIGQTEEVLAEYARMPSGPAGASASLVGLPRQRDYGGLSFQSFSLHDDAGAPLAEAYLGEPLRIRFVCSAEAPISGVILSISWHDQFGGLVSRANTRTQGAPDLHFEPGESVVEARYASLSLFPGVYRLGIGLGDGIGSYWDRLDQAIEVRVENNRTHPVALLPRALNGVAYMPVEFQHARPKVQPAESAQALATDRPGC